MPLSDYSGRAPRGVTKDAVIDRVSRHHQWAIGQEQRDECVNCGNELPLDERHLLVTLRTRTSKSLDDRRYLCDEGCLEEWTADE